jgi:hypothetical protein
VQRSLPVLSSLTFVASVSLICDCTDRPPMLHWNVVMLGYSFKVNVLTYRFSFISSHLIVAVAPLSTALSSLR